MRTSATKAPPIIVDTAVSTIIGGAFVALVRILSIQFDLNLPKFKQTQQ